MLIVLTKHIIYRSICHMSADFKDFLLLNQRSLKASVSLSFCTRIFDFTQIPQFHSVSGTCFTPCSLEQQSLFLEEPADEARLRHHVFDEVRPEAMECKCSFSQTRQQHRKIAPKSLRRISENTCYTKIIYWQSEIIHFTTWPHSFASPDRLR